MKSPCGRLQALLFILLFLALSPRGAAANLAQASRWRWSNPTPSGHHVYDVLFTNDVITTVGELGSLATSSDGISWTHHLSGVTNALRAVAYFKDKYLVSGENGLLLSGNTDHQFSAATLSQNTTAWLETIAASTTLAIAAGDAGTVYSTSDGLVWQPAAKPGTAWLRGATFGNNLFVVTGENGFIATSPDARTWTTRSSGTTKALNRVAWSGSRFWVVGDGGVVLSSVNGQSWSSISTGASQALYALVAGVQDVVIGGESELRYGRSPAGVNFIWSNTMNTTPVATNGLAPSWAYLAACPTSGGYLAAGRSGLITVATRSSGLSAAPSWSSPTEPIRNWLWDVAHLGGQYIAVGDHSTLMTSNDGISWDLELAPTNQTTSVLLGVGGSAQLAIAVGNAGALFTSTNTDLSTYSTNVVSGVETVQTNTAGALGIYWGTPSHPLGGVDLQGVAWNGQSYLVCGGNGSIMSSPDGFNWTRESAGTTNFLSSATAFGDGWCITGDKGTVLLKRGGTGWTTVKAPTTNWLYRVRAIDGVLFAVGEAGALFKSTDAISWSPIPSSTSSWLMDLAKVGGVFVAVGAKGSCLASADGMAWQPQLPFTSKSLYGLATAGGQLLSVGADGAILRAQLEPKTDPILIQLNRSASSTLVTNQFLIAAAIDQRFSFDTSTDLVQWTAGPEFEPASTNEVINLEMTFPVSESSRYFRARPR